MNQIDLIPEGGVGVPVVLYWVGPGWYGPLSGRERIFEYHIPGFDRDGFSEDDEERIWDLRDGLGTPHWLDSPDDYAGYTRP